MYYVRLVLGFVAMFGFTILVNITVALISLIIFISIIVAIVVNIREFRREMNYLNIEIHRTAGMEREYWAKRKRQLWLSLIPFVQY